MELTLKKQPFLTSTVWASLTNILRKVCFDYDRVAFTTPRNIYGDESCNQAVIYIELRRYLLQTLKVRIFTIIFS